MKFKSGGNTAVADKNGVQTQAPPAVAVQAARRMMLSAVKEHEPVKAEKIVLYAPAGWGKTTWASKAPNPVFISTEDGLKNIKAQSFPDAQTWQDLFEAIESLRQEDHDFKSLVIDTVDWSENLCHKYLVHRDKKQSIEDYGYGKGYVIAFEEWKKLLMPIDALRKEKQMNVIFLAHTEIKTFNNPAGENYDRFNLKTDKRISALIEEWADEVMFGSYDIAVDVKGNRGKAYGQDRVMYVNYSAAWNAKNRWSLTDPFPSDAGKFWELVNGGAKQ